MFSWQMFPFEYFGKSVLLHKTLENSGINKTEFYFLFI